MPNIDHNKLVGAVALLKRQRRYEVASLLQEEFGVTDEDLEEYKA